MSLSSLNLDAFSAVAREGSFSAAARSLGLTQSALSQRVMNLEKDLGATLLIREPSGIRPTEAGARLLRYCHSREVLEKELAAEIGETPGRVTGRARIAGFSTLNRSLLLPVLAGIHREQPGVRIELLGRELRDLPEMLFRGRADFIFLNQPLEREGVECELLGHEENVLVQAAGKDVPDGVFLDHDGEDSTTFDFFRLQGKKQPVLERHFLDEIYAILDGVRLGLGRAVVPLHLAEKAKGIEAVHGYRPLRVPVYLCFYTQPFYTRLQQLLLARLRKGMAAGLEK